MNNFKLHIRLIFIMIWSFSFSQEYINYTNKDGLLSNYVYKMTQDHDGFIWFITVKGISKFDGDSFKNFTVNEGLVTNDVWDIRITEDNKVWYFSKSDAIGYIENDRVYNFSKKNKKEIYPFNIYKSRNKISIQEDGYNLILKDSFWIKNTQPINQVHLLNQDKYIKRLNVFEYKVYNKNNEELLTINNSPHLLQRMYQLNDSIFLIKSDYFYKLINLNTLEVKHVEYSKTKQINGKLKTSRQHTINNQIQISGDDHLICLDNDLNWEEHYNIPKQLNSHFSFKDKDDFIWVATRENGVFKLPKNYGSILVLFSGKEILKIKEIDGILYVSVKNDGVYTLKNNEAELFFKEKEYLHDINKIGDSIFFVYDDFIKLSSKGLKRISEPDEFGFEKSFIKYHGDFFSYGYMRTLSHKKDLSLETISIEYTGLFTNNDTLFSFNQKQLLYFHEKTKKFINYPQKLNKRQTTFDTKENITFIGTEGNGVYKFENGKLSKLITEDNSIIDQIFIENSNSLWVISEGLLNHYVKNKDRFIIDKYDQINGLSTNKITSVFVKKSNLYIGFKNGLSIVKIEDLKEQISFSAYVKVVKLNDSILEFNKINIPYKSTNTLTINFGAVNFSNRKNLKYQYQLLPQQEKWITTSSGEVNLFNLLPNNYNLNLKVINNKDEKIIQIPIKIIPKWWQKFYFKVITSLVFVLLLSYIIYRINRKKQHKKNKILIQEKQIAQIQLKALRSQMNPHFVFNSLAAIQYYIGNNDFETSEIYLVKFSKLIRKFFELSKEKEITIEEEINLLENYLEIEKLRFKDRLTYKFIVDENLNIKKVKIPTMILQPIVENAVNHGIFNKLENGTISINFHTIAENEIKIEIIDDGVGFINTKKKKKENLKSSNVLNNRLYFLNQSGRWNIIYSTREAFLDKKDKGNVSTFNIKRIK